MTAHGDGKNYGNDTIQLLVLETHSGFVRCIGARCISATGLYIFRLYVTGYFIYGKAVPVGPLGRYSLPTPGGYPKDFVVQPLKTNASSGLANHAQKAEG